MRGITTVGIGVVACAGALLPGSAAAVPAPEPGFAGTWESIDVVDGSFQTLRISGSTQAGTYGTQLHDTVAQVCGGGPADVQGPGRLDVQLFVTFTLSCPGGSSPLHGRVGTLVYAYHTGSDTLTDDSGNVWYRF